MLLLDLESLLREFLDQILNNFPLLLLENILSLLQLQTELLLEQFFLLSHPLLLLGLELLHLPLRLFPLQLLELPLLRLALESQLIHLLNLRLVQVFYLAQVEVLLRLPLLLDHLDLLLVVVLNLLLLLLPPPLELILVDFQLVVFYLPLLLEQRIRLRQYFLLVDLEFPLVLLD